MMAADLLAGLETWAIGCRLLTSKSTGTGNKEGAEWKCQVVECWVSPAGEGDES